MWATLDPMLPVGSARALQFPEYETQDDFQESEVQEESDDEDSCHIRVELCFEELNVGECVEVFWSGENKWYEGEILAVDASDKTYHVHYHSDGKKLWHAIKDYPLSLSC